MQRSINRRLICCHHEVNRSSFHDTAELKSPSFPNNLESSPKEQVAIEIGHMKDCIYSSISKKIDVTSGVTEQSSENLYAIQRELRHLLAVQRQLLKKVAASEMNAKEAKKRGAVCNGKIKEFKASNRQSTERLRKEAEEHVEELIRLRVPSLHTEETVIKMLGGGGVAGQVVVHPRQWNDDARPIRRESRYSSTSSTSDESLAEAEDEVGQQTEDSVQLSNSLFDRLFRFLNGMTRAGGLLHKMRILVLLKEHDSRRRSACSFSYR